MRSGSQSDTSADLDVHDIQEIFLPRKNLPAPLYFENAAYERQPLTAPGPETQQLQLEPSGAVSTNSYFNSCYLDYWRQHTVVRRIGVRLRYTGRIQVRAVILGKGGKPVETIEQEFPDTSGSACRTAVLWAYDESNKDGPHADASRMFVSITARTRSVIKSIAYVTDCPPSRDVSLSVGLCTFNREANLGGTIDELLQVAHETRLINKIIVVNQGAEFSDPALKTVLRDPLISLISQRNLGGCGGFNRTMYEALYSDEPCTHHLLMDDDIVFDARVIRRAITYLHYASHDIVVGGHMLDSTSPTSLFEAGARLDPFWHWVVLGRHLDITDPHELRFFDQYQPVDWNGWWFCIMPTVGISEIGFSPPIFIHGDDVEFGSRFGRHGYPIVPLPGVAVWHEPFFTISPNWKIFYGLRNRLAIAIMHDGQPHRNDALYILGYCMEFLLTHRYHSAELCVEAVLEFLQGPDAVFGVDAEQKHAQVMKLTKSIPQPEPIDQIDPNDYELGTATLQSSSILRTAVQFYLRFLALSLLPFSQKPRQIIKSEPVPGMLGNRAYLLGDHIDPKKFLLLKLNRWRLWKGTARILEVLLYYLVRRKSVNQEWLTHTGHYQTKQAWENGFFHEKPK